MNRAQRRANGFRGPAYMHSIADVRPRYVRRHMNMVMAYIAYDKPMPRRIRKMVARIGRHAERIGWRGLA